MKIINMLNNTFKFIFSISVPPKSFDEGWYNNFKVNKFLFAPAEIINKMNKPVAANKQVILYWQEQVNLATSEIMHKQCQIINFILSIVIIMVYTK